MTTQARIGHGAQFKIGNGASPEVFTAVAEVKAMSHGGITRSAVEATHMDSTDGYQEFVGGLKNGGELQLTVNYVPGSATTVLLMAEINAAAGNKQVVFPGGEIFAFSGLCTAVPPNDIPLDGVMEGTVTYQVSGRPTLS